VSAEGVHALDCCWWFSVLQAVQLLQGCTPVELNVDPLTQLVPEEHVPSDCSVAPAGQGVT